MTSVLWFATVQGSAAVTTGDSHYITDGQGLTLAEESRDGDDSQLLTLAEESRDEDDSQLLTLAEESRDEDDSQLLTLAEESRDEDDSQLLTLAEEFEDDNHEIASAVDYEEFRDEYDSYELTLTAEEFRYEGDYELTSSVAEEMTNEDNGSFNDENNEEMGCSPDINTSDSECEDAAESHSNGEGAAGSQEDGDNREDLHGHDDDPLYPSASITVKVMMILILAFATRHKLTNEAISDLLYLLNIVFPKSSNYCSSLYKFKKYFDYLVTPVTFCYYCPDCVMSIDYPAEKICVICKKAYKSVKELCYYLHMSITHQISSLFNKRTFVNDILHRFKRKKLNEGHLEDIYDGSLYKQHTISGGILNVWNNLSLTWNVDGTPIFKSSKFSLWPLYLIVNELPYHLRMLKENTLFAGLWFGEMKPNMQLFLKPLVKELSVLETSGVKVTSPLYPQPFVSKVILLAGTCDLPAKCLVLNSVQFNGYYGCSKCLQPGITWNTSARGHVHVYLYNVSDPSGPKRTKFQHSRDVKRVVNENNTVNGIKGPSWMMNLRKYDIIAGTAIDYMHCVLLGVVKSLLSLWFGSEHHRCDFYIGRSVELVDKRLKEIKPPSAISRNPRAISKHFKYFKASEYRAFLLYYSLPVLTGILPVQYWDHYCLLVVAISALLSESISHDQISYCSQLLNKFCAQFSTLYGERYMSINLHLLLHLPDTVRELGPLWVYSCFHFEGQNGILKNLIHGTQKVDIQLIRSYSYLRNLPIATDSLTSTEFFGTFKRLYFKQHLPEHNCIKISEKIYLLGKPNNIVSEKEKLALAASGYGDDYKVFSRILFCNLKVNSCKWNKEHHQKNNSVIGYYSINSETVEYGIIQNFFLVNNDSSPVVFASVSKLAKHDTIKVRTNCSPYTNVHHIVACLPPLQNPDVLIIPLQHIRTPCVLMSFDDIKDCIYVAALVNLTEKD